MWGCGRRCSGQRRGWFRIWCAQAVVDLLVSSSHHNLDTEVYWVGVFILWGILEPFFQAQGGRGIVDAFRQRKRVWGGSEGGIERGRDCRHDAD
jgi:hypothetical protein